MYINLYLMKKSEALTFLRGYIVEKKLATAIHHRFILRKCAEKSLPTFFPILGSWIALHAELLK